MDIRQGDHLEHARFLPRPRSGRVLVEEISPFFCLLPVQAGAKFKMNSRLFAEVLYPLGRMLTNIEVLDDGVCCAHGAPDEKHRFLLCK